MIIWANMTEWWSGLSLELQVFYTIGITAFLVTAIQTLLTLVGLGGEAADLEFDLPEDGHSTGIGLFSVQTISAFFLGFGWAGAIALELDLHILVAVFIAFNAGGILMAAMYFMLVGLLSLQSSGNLNYTTAVDSTAEVYVTIPSNRQGNGKIQVMVGGRLITADAETDAPSAINPGQNVRVTGLIGKTQFLVEPL